VEQITPPFRVPDGLAEIKQEIPVIMQMIARTSRWVHPETFKALPIWCPDTARGLPQFDSRWSRELVNEKGAKKKEANNRAASAFFEALGIAPPKPKNWSVCHIWGYDDDRFANRANVVQNPRYYSCIGNMVWLPTPLKGFTDAVPEVKQCLRICAFHLYGWMCEYEDHTANTQRIHSGEIPDCYPREWPTSIRPDLRPRNTAPYSERVRKSIIKRKAKLRRLLADDTLEHYGHDAVREVLTFWKVDLKENA
jgi:hypothetical protein